MNLLREATAEEVSRIAETADLGPGCIVVALDIPDETILGVVRTCVEVDPIHFGKASTRWKLIFMRDVATYLIGKGAPAYYFNVSASEETQSFRDALGTFKAEQVSSAPELRFKKEIV